MSDDVETRLRRELPDLPPPVPVDLDLARGARFHARRTALRRGVAIGGTVAVVVVAGVVAAHSSPRADRKVQPTPVITQNLESVDHTYNCGRPSRPPAALTGQGGIQHGAVLARICPVSIGALAPRLRTYVVTTVVDGSDWSPPNDPLVTGLDALADQVNATGGRLDPTAGCGAIGGVRTFALTFQYLDGSLQTVQGSTRGCAPFGSPQLGIRSGAAAVLGDFTKALLAQRELMQPDMRSMYTGCPDDPGQVHASGLMLPPRTPFVHAVVCDYGAGYGRWAGTLTQYQLAAVNADLSSGLSRAMPESNGTCSAGMPLRLIVGYDAWGDYMTLRGSPCWGYRAEPSGLFWKPDPPVAAMLRTLTEGR